MIEEVFSETSSEEGDEEQAYIPGEKVLAHVETEKENRVEALGFKPVQESEPSFIP